MKLTFRLAFVFFLYATTLLAGMAWLAFNGGRNTLRSATASELQSVALEKDAAVSAWVREKQTDIGALASTESIMDSAESLFAARPGTPVAEWAHSWFLSQVTPRVAGGEFLSIMLLDPDSGEVVAATDPSEEGKFKENRLFFLNGKDGAYVQNVYYSVSLQGPAMTASAPLHTADGRLIGVLAGRLNLEEMNAIINRRAGIWRTDEAFLVNTSNLFITQPRLSPNPAVLQQGDHSEAASRCLSRSSGTISGLDYRGNPALIVYRWMPGHELCLIVKIDQAEALGPVYGFGRQVAAISAVALLGAIGLAFLFAHGVTRPIRLLQSGVVRFGQGELGTRLLERGRDELGDLAREFNRMAASLKEKEDQLRAYSVELEQRVAQRTAEIRQQEEALRDSETRYRNIMERSVEAIYLYQADSKQVVAANPAFLEILGYQADEIMALKVYDIVNEEKNSINSYLLQILAEGGISMGERSWRRKDGTIIPVEVTANRIQQSEGEFIFVVGRDIRERKQAEEQIQRSEAMLRAIIEQMPSGVTVRDARSGELVLFNTRSEEILKNVVNTPAQFEHYQGFHAGGMPYRNVDWPISRSITTGEVVHAEEIHCRQGDGSWMILSINSSPIRNQQGRIVMGISVFDDITERKRAEEALRENEERLRLSLQAANQGLYDLNVQTGAAIVNDEYAEMLGYDPKTFVETNAAWIERLHPDDQAAAAKAYRDYIGGALPEYRVEFRQKTGDGNWKWILSLGKVVECDSLGKPLRMLGTHTDITERKHAEDELNRTLEELKHSNMELEQFAYVASHDLQEPLRGIAGFAQLLQQRYQGQLDSRADEFITHIVAGTQRMQTLIDDLLAYSRIGRREAIQSTSAGTALQAALQNLNTAIQEYGATVTDECLPSVRADATQLIQLFQNLVGNAIKFRSEQPPHIHVAVTDAGEFWQFSIQDNGIGIEPQYFERIFQVFQRLHTRREYKGTGIGLAICKKITDRHGGKIWVESKPGQGSTFYFTLPKADE